MKTLTLKQSQRIEKKKKKIAAFLEIAKLNDRDREVRDLKLHLRKDSTTESSDSDSKGHKKMSSEEPSRKRIKKTHNVPDDNVCERLNEVQVELQPTEGGTCRIKNGGTSEKAPVGPCGKPLLSGLELEELRCRLRERRRILLKLPLIRLKEPGENAVISLNDDDRTPLFLSDIQHLLMFSLLGKHAPYNPFVWCHIERVTSISQTTFLLVEGLSLYDYQAHESCFPMLSRCFQTKLEVLTPSSYNGNFVEELALVPLTNNKMSKLVHRYGNIETALKVDGDVFRVLRAIFPVLETDSVNDKPTVQYPNYLNSNVDYSLKENSVVEYPSMAHCDNFPRTLLIMSPSQLIDQQFPIPVKGPLKDKYKNYVMTKDLYSAVNTDSPMFALDCEMCMTTSQELELTRISIVDEQLNCLYDTLVLPYNKITNYLTQYSGITRDMLKDVTTRLEDVQEDIRKILPMNAILVGQSLNSDLHALRMMHPYIIDTSVIFNITGDYKRKTKLSILSLKFLGEEIQSSAKGHCSTEDSAACMKLVHLKLANSVAFGDAILASRQPEYRSLTKPVMPAPEIVQNWQEGLTKPLHQGPIRPQSDMSDDSNDSQSCEHLAASMFSYLKQNDKSAAIVSTQNVINEYSNWISKRHNLGWRKSNKAVECISATSKENVILKLGCASNKHPLTLGHLRYEPKELDDPTSKEAIFRKVDAWCGQVWDKIPTNGLCVIMFGGQQGGANGVCFIQLKRREPPRIGDKH